MRMKFQAEDHNVDHKCSKSLHLKDALLPFSNNLVLLSLMNSNEVQL
jgi:hypothetical protein